MTPEDKQLVKNAFHFLIWLQKRYDAGRLTIHNLRRLLFGNRSEKLAKPKAQNSESKADLSSLQEPPSNAIPFPAKDEDKPHKGYGRLGVDDYPEAEDVYIPHPHLKAKDLCPENCGGRLYEISPNEWISIIGQSMAKAICYRLQRLRCARCGLVVKAEIPEGTSQKKYDARFKAILAVQKYFGGWNYAVEHSVNLKENNESLVLGLLETA